MARFETWVNRDLKKIMTAEDIRGTVFTLDNLGNLIGVRVFSDGVPVELSGSVNGYCILADGTTVPVAGTRSGNEAYIILPQSAYAVPGMIRIAIKLTDGSTITTLAALIGSVAMSRTDNMITPSSQVITDWSQQIAAEMQAVEDASAAQDVKIGYLENALADEAIAEFGTLDIGTPTSGYYIRKSDGATASSSGGWLYTDYIELHHSTLLITCPETSNSTQLNNVAAMAFYSAANVSSYISGTAVNLISGTAGEFTWIAVNVPSSAKYFRASVLNSISANYKIVGIESIIDFRNESLLQRGTIPGGADLDDYTTAGMWVVTSVPDPAISNWPSSTDFPNVQRIGRLVVFGNGTDAITMRVQMLIDGANNVFVRRGVNSETWKDWNLLSNSVDVDNLNDLLMGIPTRNIMDEFPQDERTILNVRFTQTGSGEYHLSGTKSGSATPRILLCGDFSTVPGKFSKGKKYSIFVKAYDAFVWISAYFNNTSSGATTLFRSESELHGEQNGTFTIPSDCTGIAVTIRMDDAASFNEDVTIYIVEVASSDKKQAITEAIFAGSVNDKKMFSVGNSFLTGICTENNHITETCKYKDAPYAQVAMVLGISEDNVNHVVHTNTAFAWPSTNYDSHSDVILDTDLSGYDYVLSHFNSTDLKKQLGTVNADGTGETLADAVVRVVNYIKTSKYICKLILLGTPPYSSQVAGPNIFTSPQGTLGNTLDDMDNLMSALALKYHFIYVGWQDLELSYHYMDFADNFVDPTVDSRHLTSVESYRAVGEYAANQIMAVNSPIAVGKFVNIQT